MRSAPRPITSVPGFVRRRNGAGVGRVYPLFQMPKGSVMTRFLIAALVAAIAAPVLAAKPADRFIDDRSSPARVITSLYNAIDRHEYLRAWSYFAEDGAPDYATFRDGYTGTGTVALRIGEVRSEGTAGAIHSRVPVAIEATDTAGGKTVFTGCYRLTQVQPGVQDTPPYRPIRIDGGRLEKSGQSFGQAMGLCETP